MHKAVQSAIFAVAVSGMACAAVRMGENMIVNGRLELEQVEIPLHWEPSASAQVGKDMFYESSGGPNGIPCARFVNNGDKPKSFILRQYRYTLVPGAKYRLSAQIRTRGFSGDGGLLVVNAGWRKTVGITGFAANSDWKFRTQDVIAPESTDLKVYSVAIHLDSFRGEIAFADLKLEPLDEAACAGSDMPAGGDSETVPRFFPWDPLVGKIDTADRRMAFLFTGKLPPGTDFPDYNVTFSTLAGEVRQPLKDGVNEFTVPVGADKGMLSYKIQKNDGVKPLLSGAIAFKVVAKPRIDTAGHRRRNNLVTDILTAELSGKGFSGSFHTTRDDGWIYVKMAAKGDYVVSIDGTTALKSRGEADEVFRLLPKAGVHRLSVVGDAVGAVEVRQIPEIINSPPCFDSYVDTNPSYGWNFFKRHVMRNATTQFGDHIPKEHLGEYYASGARLFDKAVINKILNKPDGPALFPKWLKDHSWTKSPMMAGISLDETYFGRPEPLGLFIEGMRRFLAEYDGEKPIYSFIPGKPTMPGSEREAYALAANASYGRGKVLSEIYMYTKPTEAEAKAYINDYACDTMRKFRTLRPGVPFYPGATTGMIFGNFTQIPTLSLWHHPHVDYKYFLDMQFNAIANDPMFDGLETTGVWGSYYADEEMHRWTFMLTRHYCIEGRKEMLSERYGLKYLPGILENGDFIESFGGWAVDGAMTRETIYKFAEVAEKRWCGRSGDTFAVLKKEPGKTASLSQMLKNLVPGRTYSLDVICFNAKDARDGAVRPMRIPLNVALGGAAVKDDARSWVFVDRRPKSRGFCGTRVNRHHIVFTAQAAEIPFKLDNAAAPDGFEIGVNGIGAWPYVK